MLEWNVASVVANMTELSTPQQEDLARAIAKAAEREHMHGVEIKARRMKNKFIRSTQQSDKIAHNFRMAQTLQETVLNGNRYNIL